MLNAPIKKLNNPELLKAVQELSPIGQLKTKDKYYSYLHIPDDYIHQLQPLLHDSTIAKPDYFGATGIGAHITVTYTVERCVMNKQEFEKNHVFEVQDLISAKLDNKIYYALLVNAPSLLSLRQSMGLPNLLPFKNHWIGFHITIGTK